MDAAPERPTGRSPRRTKLLVAVAVLAAAAAVLAATFDWNWFKHPIERRVTAYTGRPFTIGGDLDVDVHRQLSISLDRVSLGNAEWASAPLLASADRVRVGVAIWPLLRGELRLTSIDLDRPVVNLERNRSGVANWRFRDQPSGPARHPTIEALVVRQGTLRLREPRLRTDLVLKVDTAPPRPQDVFAPLVARGSGRYRNGDFSLIGVVDSPLQLLMSGRNYRVDVHARAGDTQARIFGQLAAPIDPAKFSLQAEISGPNLADLYPLLGFAVPESPPYELEGRLERHGRQIRYLDFDGKLGDSDMSGDVTVTLGGERPFARAKLVSKHLDFDDLAVLIGAPPDTGAGETANAEQKAEASERKAAPTVLPDKPYNLAKLRSIDADVEVQAVSVDSKKLPVRSLSAHVTLDNGLMIVRPFEVGIAGGAIAGNIRLNARHDPIATSADVHARELDLPQLFPRLESTSVGRIGGSARVKGRGNSLATMLASADGDVETVMGEGKFSNLLLELAGLDIAESVKFMIEKDRPVELRCAYADFDVEEGIMKTRALAFDTSDTVIFGRGTVDLRDEELDLTLRPRPKDLSPLALRVPLEIGGSFKHPSIRPKAGPLALRAAAAVALYAIAPPAALLALIEAGPGGNANCSFAESGGTPTESADAAPPRHDDDAKHVKPPQWKKPA